ncbi:hypothetical protein Tco_1029178 [Tanacetum coccineum]|uniref:Uncharacterized protein n=1 Tax=Tanacetum coccineum TaxID=301880 RepID=A0ABQ5G4X8_9ASTR
MMNNKGFFFFKFNSQAGLEAVLESGILVDFLISDHFSIMSKDTRLPKEELLTQQADLWMVVTISILYLLKKGYSTKATIFCTGPSVKQNLRYEPKASTRAPKKGATNVGDASKLTSSLKNIVSSSKNDNIVTSNSYFALGEEDAEEDVKNVYDESANLFTNTQTGGSSSFTVVVG